MTMDTEWCIIMKNKKIKYNGTQDLLKRFLEKVPDALGVAIYDIDQNCIVKLIKGGVKKN